MNLSLNKRTIIIMISVIPVVMLADKYITNETLRCGCLAIYLVLGIWWQYKSPLEWTRK